MPKPEPPPSPETEHAAALAEARDALFRSSRIEVEAIEPIAGDLGSRRHDRLHLAGGETAVLATYPPDTLDQCRRFVGSTRLLDGAGVRVPRLLAADCEAGLVVVEDLGPQTLFDWQGSEWETLLPFYRDAADIIQRIAGLPAEEVAALNRPIDLGLMQWEMERTYDNFFAPRGLAGDESFSACLRGFLDELCHTLAEAPPVPCHRDLMPRNLIPFPGSGTLGVVDHQDLRLGPPAYDLASLLNDSLFPPPEVEEEIIGAVVGDDPEARTAYHRVAVERTLKAVGTFAVQGAPRHRALIGPTLGRTLAHLGRLPEAREVAPRCAELWTETVESAPDPDAWPV